MVLPALTLRQWVIYKITNPEGGVYIGKTCDWFNRMSTYKSMRDTKQRLLSESFMTLGYDNHTVEIIDTFLSDKEYSDGKEIFWIRSFMSNRNKYPHLKGLNLTDGQGGLGVIVSDEKREKQRKSMMGHPTSDYQKQRAREVHKGNTYNLGKKRSEETKKLQSERQKGKKYTPEQRENCRIAQVKANGMPVIQTDKDGNFIREFAAKTEVESFFGISEPTVNRLLANTSKFRWGKTKDIFIKYK